jgi:mannose-1-phosphate guanylyltransferase/phosphomannomutase
MKAVIMAGGEGTRLRPLTSTQPKPMLPMANVPMMEHIVRLLVGHGFEEVVVTVAYLSNSIRTYFGDGSEFGVKISYVSEDSPLGTAGSVGNARDLLSDRFLVISGDVLTDIDLGAALQYHDEKNATVTVVLQRVENPLEFGIVTTDNEGAVTRFLEKPSWGEVFSDTVNTGIYILEPEIFDYIPIKTVSDFSSDVFPRLLSAQRPIYGWISDGYWEDVGTLAGYLKAHRDILEGRVKVTVDGFQVRPSVYFGQGCQVHPDARVEDCVIIGPNVRVSAGAHIRRYSVLGASTRVGDDAVVENSVIADHCYLGPQSHVTGAVVGSNCDLRRGVTLEDGVVVGDDCYIGEEAIVQPFVKIYPSKNVQSRSIVNTSIVWESRAVRTLFSGSGLSGLANVDVTPEIAVRLGMALGSTLPQRSIIVASRDTSKAARMLKRAVMVGSNAVGVSVSDLEVGPTPLTRYHVRYSLATAGFRVFLGEDPDTVEIRLFDSNGAELSESEVRKIERAMAREDFRKMPSSEIGDISFPGRVVEHYSESLLDVIDVKSIRERNFRIVMDYSFGTVGLLLHSVLGKLNAEVLSFNPYAATGRAISLVREEQRDKVSRVVVESGSDLGVIFNPAGESFELIDNKGRVLIGQDFVYAMVELFALEHVPGSQFYLSVESSNKAIARARDRGIDTYFTKSSSQAMCHDVLEASGKSRSQPLHNEGRDPTSISLGLSPSGSMVLSGVVAGPDGVFNLAKMLEVLARHGRSLDEITRDVPPIFVKSAKTHTPFELKGSLMRYLLESEASEGVLLIDGIRTSDSDGGFTLIAPDPEDALTKVTVESRDERETVDKLSRAIEWVSSMLREI